MIRKRIMLLLIFIMTTTSFLGCSNNDTQAKNTASSKIAPAVDPSKPVNITVFSTNGDSPASFDDRWGNSLRKKFPNWQINYIQSQKGNGLTELLTAGTKIDLYFESVAAYLTGKDNDLWYDMSDLIKKSNLDLNRFEPATIDAVKLLSDGKMTGIPVNMNTMSLYYNKDIFDKLGVPYLKDGMKWNEVVTLSRKLTFNSGDKQYLGFAESLLHIVRLNPLSISLVDPKTNKSTLGDERWKRLLNTIMLSTKEDSGYKNWITTANGNKFGGQGNFYGSQNAAMLAALAGLFTTNAKDLETVNWDMVSFPSFEETPGVGAQAYPTIMSVTKLSDHKEESTEILKYLTSDEMQMEASRKGIMTVLKNEEIRKAIGQDGKFKDKNLKSVYYNKFATPLSRTTMDGALEQIPYDKIVDVLLGTMDVNSALRMAEEQSNKVIDEKMAAKK